jgi:hypothetical protein
MIVCQCNENNINIDTDTGNITLPIYKDTDTFFKYRLEDIESIHERILSVIDVICVLNINKKEIVKNYRKNIAVGFSLKLFLQTLDYEICIIQDQTQLFVNYVKFYHSSQRTYLEKLVKKIVIFSEELDNNVKKCNTEILPDNMIFSELDPSESNSLCSDIPPELEYLNTINEYSSQMNSPICDMESLLTIMEENPKK